MGPKKIKFKLHKSIISLKSNFFKALFSNLMLESKENLVNLPYVSPDNFTKIIEFIYNGKTIVCDIYKFLEDVMFLQIDILIDICIRIIKKNVSLNNIFKSFEFAWKYSIDGLGDLCVGILENNCQNNIFHIISAKKDDIQRLSFQLFIYLIEDNLFSMLEHEVLRLIFLWGNLDEELEIKEEKRIEIQKLIKCLNITRFSDQELYFIKKIAKIDQNSYFSNEIIYLYNV